MLAPQSNRGTPTGVLLPFGNTPSSCLHAEDDPYFESWVAHENFQKKPVLGEKKFNPDSGCAYLFACNERT
jgi:hypothetical protein